MDELTRLSEAEGDEEEEEEEENKLFEDGREEKKPFLSLFEYDMGRYGSP